jgi:tetratricopeptide (TPR) repeat protein
MPARRDASFAAGLRHHVGAITAALSFVAVIMSFVQAWGSNARAAATAVLAAVSVLLLAYNVWLWRSERRGSVLSGEATPGTLTKRRFALHVLSGMVLVVAWGAVGVSVWDRYAVRVLLATLGCDSALPRLEQYVEADGSEDVPARLSLAECYSELDRPADEVDALDKLLADDEALTTLDAAERATIIGRTHFGLGLVHLAEDDYTTFEPQPERALHHLREARRYSPANPILLFALGFAEAWHGGEGSSGLEQVERLFAAGRAALERSSPPRPDLVFQYHYWYGRSLIKAGAWDSAVREFEAALGALGAAMEGQARSDWRDKVLYRLGLIELSRNDDQIAARERWGQMSSREEIVKALTLSGLNIWRDGVIAQNEGDAARATEFFNQAEPLLSDALRQGARSTKVYLALGMLQFSLGHYGDAVVHFDKLIALQPSSPLGHYWLGRSAFQHMDYPNARRAFEDAASIEPTDAHTHYWLARTLKELNEIKKADEVVRKSIDFDPTNAQAHLFLLELISTQADQETTEDAKARLMEQALAQAKASIAVSEAAGEEAAAEEAQLTRRYLWNGLAYYYARNEALALAEDYIDRALGEDADEPHFLDTKALILIMSAERSPGSAEAETHLSQAEMLLKSALEQLSDTEPEAAAESWVHLGQIEALRRRKDAAERHYIKALELDPQNAEAKQFLR